MSAVAGTEIGIVQIPIPPLRTIFPAEIVLNIIYWLPVWVLKLLKGTTFFNYASPTLNRRVEGLLRSWALPPTETLIMMRARNTFFSKDAALFTVEPGWWFPDKLDFFTPHHEFITVSQWFLRHDYQEIAALEAADAPKSLHRDDMEWEDNDPNYWEFPRIRYSVNAGVEKVIVLRHLKTGLVIHLNRSYSDSPLVPICMFPTTLQMNFVSGNGVVCLYPRYTSRDCGLLNMQWDPPAEDRDVCLSTLKMILAYQSREYRFTHGTAPVPFEQPSRSWDDGHAVQMPFDIEHPITVYPTVLWGLSLREYTARGYRDHDAFVRVLVDCEEIVYQERPQYISKEVEFDDNT